MKKQTLTKKQKEILQVVIECGPLTASASADQYRSLKALVRKGYLKEEQRLMQNPLPFIQEAVNWINEGCEPEDMFPNPISAIALEASVGFGSNGSYSYIIADVTWEGEKVERLKVVYGDNSGGLYEPPCEEYEIWENPMLKLEELKAKKQSFQELLEEILNV